MAQKANVEQVKTRVVNLRNSPYDVYIGRAGHGLSGTFGNPIKKGGRCPECQQVHETGGATLPCFETYFLRRVSEDETFRNQVLALRGLRLGCFCFPRLCHGTIIKNYLDKQEQA